MFLRLVYYIYNRPVTCFYVLCITYILGLLHVSIRRRFVKWRLYKVKAP